MATSSKGKQPAPTARDWRFRDYEEGTPLQTERALEVLKCPFRLTPEKTNEIPDEYTKGVQYIRNTTEPDSVPWMGFYAPYRTARIAVANAYGIWFEIAREHGDFLTLGYPILPPIRANLSS